jgi:hypothetical protein
VRTVDDRKVALRIPAGTQSNTRFRISGQGVEKSGRRGDQYVQVKVEMPDSLSPEQERLMKEFADAAEPAILNVAGTDRQDAFQDDESAASGRSTLPARRHGFAEDACRSCFHCVTDRALRSRFVEARTATSPTRNGPERDGGGAARLLSGSRARNPLMRVRAALEPRILRPPPMSRHRG